jgi:general secretion pathway protein C
MAVSLNPRAERLLARLPRVTVYSLLELFLLLLIAIQCARLFWAVLTPVGPLGEWKALDMMRPAAPTTPLLGSFDPFFRQAPGAPGGAATPVVVTALDVRLYGVVGNQASGAGSAIIGPPNGQQRIVTVGEEIMPGVVLTGVGFDYVIINRNGAAERLYLDQSPAPAGGAAPTVAPGSPPSQFIPPPPVQPTPIISNSPLPPQAPPPATAQTLKVDQ